MLQEIRAISNPWVRGILAGTLVATVVTLPLSLGVSLVKAKQSGTYRWIVYASAVSALFGAGFGALSKTRTPTKSSAEGSDPKEKSGNRSGGWRDWRPFVVTGKVQESEEITSFYLTPQEGGSLPGYQPGQFLTLQLAIPGQARPVIRSYSLSDYSLSQSSDFNSISHYRLSIKREPAPAGSDYPPGLASGFMHDQIREGSVLQVKPPSGTFVLDPLQSVPVVLVSNGVGITPMISMLKACCQLNPNRPVWFVHGSRQGSFHAFREEINHLSHPNLHLFIRYSRPAPTDQGLYHSQGYVDIDFLKTVVVPDLEKVTGSQLAEFYLCGSPPFLDGLRTGLKEWGIPSSQVFYEVFASAPKSTPSNTADRVGANQGQVDDRNLEATKPDKAGSATSCEVIFGRTGQVLTWTATAGTLLELAEAHQIDHPFGCRAGVCLSCMCPLQSGEVVYPHPPSGQPDPGQVLLCVGYPKGPRIILDA